MIPVSWSLEDAPAVGSTRPGLGRGLSRKWGEGGCEDRKEQQRQAPAPVGGQRGPIFPQLCPWPMSPRCVGCSGTMCQLPLPKLNTASYKCSVRTAGLCLHAGVYTHDGSESVQLLADTAVIYCASHKSPGVQGG